MAHRYSNLREHPSLTSKLLAEHQQQSAPGGAPSSFRPSGMSFGAPSLFRPSGMPLASFSGAGGGGGGRDTMIDMLARHRDGVENEDLRAASIDYVLLTALVEDIVDCRRGAEAAFARAAEGQWETFSAAVGRAIERVERGPPGDPTATTMAVLAVSRFANTNKEGFKKIIKKHDRHSPHKLGPGWKFRLRRDPVRSLYPQVPLTCHPRGIVPLGCVCIGLSQSRPAADPEPCPPFSEEPEHLFFSRHSFHCHVFWCVGARNPCLPCPPPPNPAALCSVPSLRGVQTRGPRGGRGGQAQGRLLSPAVHKVLGRS